MKKSSVNAHSLLSKLKLYTGLIFVFFCVLVAFVSSPFDGPVLLYGTLMFAVVLGIMIQAINDLASALADKADKKQKELDVSKAVIVDIFKHKDVQSFVEKIIDDYLKTKSEKFPDFICEIVCNNDYVYGVFVEEIKSRIIKTKDSFNIKNDATVDDVLRYGLSLAVLNDLLRLLNDTVLAKKSQSESTKQTSLKVSGLTKDKYVPTFGCGVGISN